MHSRAGIYGYLKVDECQEAQDAYEAAGQIEARADPRGSPDRDSP